MKATAEETAREIYKKVMGHDVPGGDYQRGSFTWSDIKSLMEAAVALRLSEVAAENERLKFSLRAADADNARLAEELAAAQAEVEHWREEFNSASWGEAQLAVDEIGTRARIEKLEKRLQEAESELSLTKKAAEGLAKLFDGNLNVIQNQSWHKKAKEALTEWNKLNEKV